MQNGTRTPGIKLTLYALVLALFASLNLNAQHTPAGTTTERLGTGAASLLGGDLTDPDNNGLDALGGATDPSWNWATIDANIEPDFEGGENSFNIFDNAVGGGNAKWCCDDPTIDNPYWVAVEFTNAVALTHFTVTSGNDAADRDPINWSIQGSNDGSTYTDIYHFEAATATPWNARNQVVKFTLPAPATPYKFIRYIVYVTPGTLHQLNEIEYFGLISGDRFVLSEPTPNYRFLSFKANNTTTSQVDTNTIVLRIDGEIVPVVVTENGPVVDIRHSPTTWFALTSQHTYSIEVKDTQGNTVTDSGNFTVPQGFFPLANLPSAAPPAGQWAVRHIWNTGADVGSLATAITLARDVGTAAQVGETNDIISADIDFGPGGLFTYNNPYPEVVTTSGNWAGDHFVQFGVFNLTITEESDYTFGIHSDDGFGLRIRGAGASVGTVSGNGTADPNDPEAIVHPGTTGDSNTRAVYHLMPGTYRLEFVRFDAAAGDYGEIYWAKGNFTADASTGADWKLIGSDKPPIPLFPAGNLPSPGVSNGVWSVRFISGYTDPVTGAIPQVNSLALAMQIINESTRPDFTGTIFDTTAPVINWVGGGRFGSDTPLPPELAFTDDYIMLAVGHITVAEEGDYTFGTHSDDGMGFRIVGAERLSVSGNGRRDIGNTDAVVHPGTSGDSNTRAVYHLQKGIYRVEYLYFERGGGDNGEFYVAKGAFVNDADTANWMLVGDPTGGRDYRVLGLDAAGVTVTSSDPGGDPLNTLAEGLADYEATGSTGSSTNFTVADVGDPESNAGVRPFPKNTPGLDDDFAVKLTGNIVVPQAGTYVIGFNSDDGGYVKIPGQSFIEIQPGANVATVLPTPDEINCDCLTGDANSFATITLAAGTYPFEAFLFERAGGAYIRVKGAEAGAPMANMPALSVGGAGLFRTQPSLGPLTTQPPAIEPGNEGPEVTVTRSGNTLTIAWSPTGGTLETTSSLSGVPIWTAVGTQNPATVQVATDSAAAFYRVRK